MNITVVNRMLGIRFGGGENMDINLADYLEKNGNNVRIVAGTKLFKPPINIYIHNKNIEIKYIKTPYLRGISYSLDNSRYYLVKKIASVFRETDLLVFNIVAWLHLRKDKWTEVYQILSLPLLGIWLKNAKRKIVISLPGPPTLRAIRRCKKCDASFANGDAYIQAKKDGFEEIKYINIGVDINRFKIKNETKNNSRFTFLFVGRIVPIKNVPFLIEGFYQASLVTSNIQLVLVGEGETNEQNKVLALVEKYNLSDKVIFKGKKFGDDLINEYQNADCFIITSDYDNFPNVVLEAMACGLPVVGTKVGGIPAQVTHNHNGLLVESRNVLELKDAIISISKNPDKAKEMGAVSRKITETEFSWEKQVEELEKIYKSI